jgi:tRNA/tmRNA/rRNA uracil-C5-methylase (TrmA/RlmC/RlmD family)
VRDWIKQNQDGFSIIVLDPPRSGITEDVIKFLALSKAKKIIYISCNPSTLARDLMIIVKNTKYKVKKITPIDMFPQTYHIEVVVLLEL